MQMEESSKAACYKVHNDFLSARLCGDFQVACHLSIQGKTFVPLFLCV